MPSKSKTPAINAVEKGLMDAFDRLVAGTPNNTELQKKAKSGLLQIDKLSVALEAGRSRTTLYKYPKVVARIEALSAAPAATAHDVIAKLREENRDLKKRAQLALSAAAAMLLRMRNIEQTTKAEIRKAVRNAKRDDPMKVVGVEKVIQFPGGGGKSNGS